jgi:hypothetical protein
MCKQGLFGRGSRVVRTFAVLPRLIAVRRAHRILQEYMTVLMQYGTMSVADLPYVPRLIASPERCKTEFMKAGARLGRVGLPKTNSSIYP